MWLISCSCRLRLQLNLFPVLTFVLFRESMQINPENREGETETMQEQSVSCRQWRIVRGKLVYKYMKHKYARKSRPTLYIHVYTQSSVVLHSYSEL